MCWLQVRKTEIDEAFGTAVQRGVGALLVGGDAYFNSRRAQLIALAARHGLPANFDRKEIAIDGGLMSYGMNNFDMYRQVGIYTGQILKGAKPADLPVQQPTKVELVVNLKTAKSLGLELPTSVLAERRRGDRVKRREFITLLGGAAAAWPLAARAQQQPERMRRIGFWVGEPETDPNAQRRVTAFKQGLAELGWIEGRTVLIEYRWPIIDRGASTRRRREPHSPRPGGDRDHGRSYGGGV